jgi:hypothetical protein
MKTKTSREQRRPKPDPETPIEPRPVSPELQAGIDRFARSLGHILLMKIDREAARRMPEDAA